MPFAGLGSIILNPGPGLRELNAQVTRPGNDSIIKAFFDRCVLMCRKPILLRPPPTAPIPLLHPHVRREIRKIIGQELRDFSPDEHTHSRCEQLLRNSIQIVSER